LLSKNLAGYRLWAVICRLDAHGRVPKSARSDGDKADHGFAVTVI